MRVAFQSPCTLRACLGSTLGIALPFWHSLRQQHGHLRLQPSLLLQRCLNQWQSRYSQQEDDLIIKRRKQGHTYAHIGRELGRLGHSVRRRYAVRLQYKDCDAPIPRDHPDPELTRKVLHCRKDGITFPHMSKVLGEPVNKLRQAYYCSQEGCNRPVPKGPLSPPHMREMLKLKSQGHSWHDIAKALGRTYGSVAGQYGQMLPCKDTIDIDREIRVLHDQGLTETLIAERLAFPVAFVERRLGTGCAKIATMTGRAPKATWTKDDIKTLQAQWQTGSSTKQIGVKLGRSPYAVKTMICRHRDDWGLEYRYIQRHDT